MIDAFLWSGCNRREDGWGGNLHRRGRFAVEVVRAVRRNIGEEKPIFFRFSQWKQQDYAARLAASPAELEQILGPRSEERRGGKGGVIPCRSGGSPDNEK